MNELQKEQLIQNSKYIKLLEKRIDELEAEVAEAHKACQLQTDYVGRLQDELEQLQFPKPSHPDYIA